MRVCLVPRSIVPVVLLLSLTVSGKVLDDFNDNTRTGWTDFTFQAGFGIPVEANSKLRFEQPPANTPIFSATRKTTESFELKDGRTIEMRVDVTETGGKDSFAILAFLPTTNSPATLAGYGLAKSTTDVLMTKGINRYFVAEGWPPSTVPGAASANITLVLTMRANAGTVTITGKILDKSNNNAVLWEKTVVDTPNEDVVVPEGDQPKEPFITSGYFTLFLYQDFAANAVEDPYFVEYDNAQVSVSETTILDDFNDNSKTGWTDFTFQAGFGLPNETQGQFRFEQPPANTQIFSASQKTTRAFELMEGERLEFSIDVQETGGKDSFAVLGFIPTTNLPGTLSGYGLSKSTTDVLISKGINRYFVAEGWPPSTNPAAANAPITMSLALAASGGNVTITGKILDKSNTNAVLWEKTVVDTPNEDVVVPGGDQPKEPFITSGYFTLFLFQDFAANAVENPYFVYYDNAIVTGPPLPANTAPIISAVQPEAFKNFLPASASISFAAADDKALADDKFSITVNGVRHTSTNGVSLSAAGNSRTATLSGILVPNVNYNILLEVEDSDGEKVTQTVYFDTFAANSLVLEIEDYNFGGSFLDNPTLSPEDPFSFDPVDGSYRNQLGVEGIDFHDTRTSPSNNDRPYRKNDPVRMAQTLDFLRAKYEAAGGSAAFIFDYDVGDVAAGEWLNYTHTFPAGSYEVYLRQSLVNLATSDATLEEVTSDPTQPSQTTRSLGSFLGARSGYQYRNIPLTDGTGANKVIVRLSGPATLRLRQNTTDPEESGLRQNYLLFLPVADPGLQRATVSSISPAPNSTVDTVAPVIRVELQNRDTTVKSDSIKLFVNGSAANATITTNANGAIVDYAITPLPAAGSVVTARIEFQDDGNVAQTNEWSFTVTYDALNPANRRTGAGQESGFNIRMVQAPQGSGLENSLNRAEEQLDPNSAIAKFVDTNTVIEVVNFNKVVPSDQGNFASDMLVPGLDPDINGADDFTVEVTGYLDLPAGIHKFGVLTDDGYKIQSGAAPGDRNAPLIAFHDGGPANETFDIVVVQPGLYPFRFVWYERGGAAYAEWFTVRDAERILMNDRTNPNAIRAFRSVAQPALQVESATVVNGPYAVDSSATVDTTARIITIPAPSGNRFYRLNGSSQLRIKLPRIAGNNFTFEYE